MTAMCLLALIYVGVQITEVHKVLAHRWTVFHEPLTTVYESLDGRVRTTLTTVRQPGELGDDFADRHHAMQRIIESRYKEARK